MSVDTREVAGTEASDLHSVQVKLLEEFQRLHYRSQKVGARLAGLVFDVNLFFVFPLLVSSFNKVVSRQ